MLKTILQLKRTVSTINNLPMGWRELATRIGMKSGQLAQYHARKELAREKRHRCPQCLQSLREETKPQ